MRSQILVLLALTGCQSGFLGFGGGPQLARGLFLDKISVYQSVEIPVMDNFEPASGLARPAADHEALVRVFVRRGDLFEPRDISATLILDNDGDTTELEQQMTVTADSSDGMMNTTFNFDLTREQVTESTAISVELREVSKGVKADGDDSKAVWPTDGVAELHAQHSAAIEVVLVPIKYNADGSGRLPDTSDDQVALYQALFSDLYPATDVTVSVDDPVSWSRPVEPYGQGWDELLYAMMTYRQNADVPPNTYFYGIFAGSNTLGQYCQQGCVLGLSTVPGPSDVYGRASIGVGYSGETSVETAVHEVGHAHGREHAPCGLYGQPSDRDYPYPNAELGVWGYDAQHDDLLDPTDTVDMMSYCSPLWMSDYTFEGIRQRISDVDTGSRAAALPASQRAFRSALVKADGTIEVGEPMELLHRPSGEVREIEVESAGGRATVEASFLPFDHLDGGVLVFPDQADVRSVRIR